MRSVRIGVRPRVHLGLLSMHDSAPRINGGIGFAIEGPKAQIEIGEGSEFSVRDERQTPMAAAEIALLVASVESFAIERQLSRPADIRISGDMLTHAGMGSGTAIRLGVLEAIARLNEVEIERTELVAASGRGGTSGVGVNSYFDGGLICDLGHSNEGQGFTPSSLAGATRQPLALPRIMMPDWPLLLCVPRGISFKTQAEEIAFFDRMTPLQATESYETSYIALFEVYAAAAEASYTSFCRGVERMQHTPWKQAERLEYGAALVNVEAELLKAGADCAGMSSLGPMLFCFAFKHRLPAIEDAAKAMGCEVYRTIPANSGRDIHLSHA